MKENKLFDVVLPEGNVAVLGVDSGKDGAWCFSVEGPRGGRWADGTWKGIGEGLAGLKAMHDVAAEIEQVLWQYCTSVQQDIKKVIIIHELPVSNDAKDRKRGGRTNGHITFRPAYWLSAMLYSRFNPNACGDETVIGVEPIGIYPAQWRGKGMGRTTKELKLASIERCKQLFMAVGEEVKNHHLADAIMMADWVRNQLPVMRAMQRTKGVAR